VWYQTLATAFKALGFNVCAVDHAVFVLCEPEVKVIVAVSTDDLLMISKCQKRLEAVKRGLKNHFEMTDLGEACWLLGVEIRHDHTKRTLSLLQGVYVQTILGQFNLENTNTVTTPMDPGVHLSKSQSPTTEEEKEDMANVPYCKLIGLLMYTTVATRPVSRFPLALSRISRRMRSCTRCGSMHVTLGVNTRQTLKTFIGIRKMKTTAWLLDALSSPDWRG
jgi:hypothetical protein